MRKFRNCMHAVLLYICMLRCYLYTNKHPSKRNKLSIVLLTCAMLPRSILLPNKGKFHVGKLLMVDKCSTKNFCTARAIRKYFRGEKEAIYGSSWQPTIIKHTKCILYTFNFRDSPVPWKYFTTNISQIKVTLSWPWLVGGTVPGNPPPHDLFIQWPLHRCI